MENKFNNMINLNNKSTSKVDWCIPIVVIDSDHVIVFMSQDS